MSQRRWHLSRCRDCASNKLASRKMELLLNLVWVLLAIPAYFLWRNANRAQHIGASSLQCLFALGCALILLFPVISATDDLHAMRAEMDESSKRNIRQAFNDKSCGSHGRWHNVMATPVAVVVPLTRGWLELLPPPLVPVVAPARTRTGRGPPPFLSSGFAHLS
jgi:hypothetical protein